MPHRKFEHPRHGHWAFSLGKKPPDIEEKAFPKDDPTKPCKLTAFLGYKARMTHIVGEVEKLGSTIVARGRVETLRPALQRLYMTRAYAYRDALKSFIEGYQEGIQQIMKKKEDSSKAQQEGNTDKNST
ncbi:hypothetical protein PVK06_041657 [Gossypium arboreum]|uniref:Uncharacterized protein n=1 Tax=Gossypium arboreum TaxID=29729 RepID=A0ABR0N8V0_GOSAR|nr:hypothetical protein PVK06_041657 [Gossypium arboreum]